MPSKMGTCPLCGEQRELTKEHVVPAWMLRDMRDKLTWIAPELGVVRELVVPVCRACNTWMNRRIETPAMPLLRSLNAGTERVLTSKQQMRLAVWFTKSYMMYDIAGDPDLVTPHPHYIEFRRTGRPTLGPGCGSATPTRSATPGQPRSRRTDRSTIGFPTAALPAPCSLAVCSRFSFGSGGGATLHRQLSIPGSAPTSDRSIRTKSALTGRVSG